MQFGMVGWMGLGMRPAVGFGDWSTEGIILGGECRVPNCNQWGLCGIMVPFQITPVFLAYFYFVATGYGCCELLHHQIR